MELVSAKYLIGANLNGTSEPYAVISLGEQKRFRRVFFLILVFVGVKWFCR